MASIAPVDSESNKSNASRISCFCSSVISVRYLYVTVRNLSIDCIRRQTRLQKLNKHLIDLEVEWYEHYADEEKEDRLRRVNHAIQKLPEKVGLIFRRCCFDGLTYRQVAEEMHLSEASIHKYMVKAFAELRNNI